MDIKPQLVDMKLPPRRPEEGRNMPMAMNGETPEFPYGLCLHLGKEQIDALNLMEMPETGESYKILATGVVTMSQMEPGGGNPNIGIQITALQLIPGEKEEESEDEGSPAGNKPNTVIGNRYRSYD